MISNLFDVLEELYGIGRDWAELGPVHLSARAVTLYLCALLVVRLGNARLLGKGVAFDVLLGFVLGSLLCRAIVGSDTLFQTVVAAGVMLGVHGMVAVVANRHARETREVVEVVEVAKPPVAPVPTGATQTVALALVPRDPQPTETRIIDVQVADGVQTVRIAIG